MIVRFKQVKDKHDFINRFKKVNNKNNVIMRDITVMDSDIECVISMRNDKVEHIIMPIEYKNVKFKIIDRNKI